MTKVQTHYNLVRPLHDDDAQAIANVHSWYGILRVKPSAALDQVDVEYDASRLTEKDVEGVLHRFGVPVVRRWAVP